MKVPVAKIGLLLLLIIVLPLVFFSAYEVSNMYKNEEMIDSIYTRQLESVIFSINQYSDDVVSGWASEIDDLSTQEGADREKQIEDFIRGHLSVNFVFFSDSALPDHFYASRSFRDSIPKYQSYFSELLMNQEGTIKRLLQYMRSGYQKIQPLDIDLPNQSLFLFASEVSESEYNVCGLVVNTESFIRENLGPRIQSVARNTFYISVFNRISSEEVYSNEVSGSRERHIEHKKNLWLFPDYELGIELKGETVEDLVRERTYYNILIIGILDIVLLLAAWFVYRAVRQEVKLAQLKSDFVANVSHEIRTPLAIINMYSETLEMGRVNSEEKKHEYYKVINTETNRLSGIVNKILSFSKIESGKREYKFEDCDLNEIVENLLGTYTHHFNDKGFEYTFHARENLSIIKADAEAVTDALINLIDNAMKYSQEDKKIEISTGRSLSHVYIEVKDYGIGISSKDQKFIFDKFYRVTSGDLAYKAKGSGIGLSIVKHIMDAHGGTITLTSKPGKGSTFTMSFPVDKS